MRAMTGEPQFQFSNISLNQIKKTGMYCNSLELNSVAQPIGPARLLQAVSITR